MKKALKTINVIDILTNYAITNYIDLDFINNMRNLISNMEREPMEYIEAVINNKIQFYNGHCLSNRVLLDSETGMIGALKGVNIETIKDFLFIEYPINGERFDFPLQFSLQRSTTSGKHINKLLILKALSVNLMERSTVGYHFITYVREEFKDSFLLINDGKIKRSQISEVHKILPRLALYFVINIS